MSEKQNIYSKKQDIEPENARETVELPTDYAVVSLPSDAVWVEMVVKVMRDGEIVKIAHQMDTKAIRDAFKEAEKNYLPDDAVFTLTEKGRELAKQIENDPNFDWDAYFGPITPLKS